MGKYKNKKRLTELSENFFEKARDANCYFDITEQFVKNKNERSDEMSLSSAFYTYTENATIVAVIMELAKLYDTSKQSINIKKFLDICSENRNMFPKYKESSFVDSETNEIIKVPYVHRVSTDEIDFFKDELDSMKATESLFLENPNPLSVEMTIDRYFELFYWKYDKLKIKIDYLIKQRNKVYAHNDEDKIFNIDQILQKYPIHYKDAESLISYALEVSGFSVAMLTDINKAKLPNNIKDWENTLNLVKDGKQYQKEKFEKEFGEGSFSD